MLGLIITQTFGILFIIFSRLSSASSLHSIPHQKISDQQNLIELRSRIEDGQKQLESVLNSASEEVECWRENIWQLLNEECSSLTYNSQANIAFRLSICHLSQSGFDISLLTNIHTLSSDTNAFSTYNHFFTNVDNICLFSQMRNQQTILQESIHSLYSASINTADFLHMMHTQSTEHQQRILAKQKNILRSNQRLAAFHIEHHKEMAGITKMSQHAIQAQVNIRDTQREMQDNQKTMLTSVLELSAEHKSIIDGHKIMMEENRNLSSAQQKLQSSMVESLDMQYVSANNQQKMQEMSIHLKTKMMENIANMQSNFQKSYAHHMQMLELQLLTNTSVFKIDEKVYKMAEHTKIAEEQMRKFLKLQSQLMSDAHSEIAKLHETSNDTHSRMMAMLNEALQKIEQIFNLDITLFREFHALQCLLFYLAWIALAYLGTTPKCATNARLPIFLSIAFCAYIENSFLTEYYVYIHWIRKCILCAQLFIYCYFVFGYQNAEQVQLKILRDIKKNIKQNMNQNMKNNRKCKRITFSSVMQSITPENIRGFFCKTKKFSFS